MIFDTRVKNEIIKTRYQTKEELLAFLSGLAHTSAELIYSDKGFGIEITSDFDTIHRAKSGFEYAFSHAKAICDPLTFESEEKEGLVVLKYIGDGMVGVLEDLQIMEGGEISWGLPNFGKDKTSRKMQSAYIAGAFLGAGRIIVPQRSRKLGYSVEFSFTYEKTAEEFEKLLLNYGIEIQKIVRKERTLLLARTADTVADVLNVIGAKECFFDFQEMIVVRSRSEKNNRAVNCGVANEDRSVIASVKQVLAITQLKETDVFFTMEENLQDIANLRLANPNSSLEELGKMLDPPISKSGANHRMRKIIKIASELSSQKESDCEIEN